MRDVKRDPVALVGSRTREGGKGAGSMVASFLGQEVEVLESDLFSNCVCYSDPPHTRTHAGICEGRLVRMRSSIHRNDTDCTPSIRPSNQLFLGTHSRSYVQTIL